MQKTIQGHRVCECLPQLTNHLHAAQSVVTQLGKGKYPPMMKQYSERAYYVPIHILTHLIPIRDTLILSFHLRLRLPRSVFQVNLGTVPPPIRSA